MRCADAVRRRTSSLAIVAVILAFAVVHGAGCGGTDSGGGVTEDVSEDGFDVPVFPDTVAPDARSDVRKPDTTRPGDGEPGKFGSPCRRNEDCEDGWCVGWDEGYVCTQTCLTTEGCPEGWQCRGIFGTAPDVVFVCYPDQSNLCRPCASDFECDGGYCVTFEGEQHCTRPCSDMNACPAHYACQSTTSEEDPTFTTRQCLPTGGSCTCGPINVGKKRTCLHENEFGECVGVETCDEEDGWVGCSAPVPGPEVCDGEDNDCDGFDDNDPLPPEAPCESVWTDPAGVEDDIVCTGAWVCNQAGPDTAWRCTSPVAGPEVCDRVDNDCDGETDEGFRDAATGRYDTYEHCGQCNVSCEGAIAFAAETECVPDDGDGARCVVVACQPGYFVPPDFDDICVRVGPVANCTPCAEDDDCAALPGTCHEEPEQGRSYCAQACPLGDECPDGYACTDGRCRPLSDSCNCLAQHEGLTRPCANEGPLGICLGLSTCDPDTGWSACSARVPSDEDCNGIDDDCDGTTDIGMQPPGGSATCALTNGFGTCQGSWVCAAGRPGEAGWRCTAPEPGIEACDLRDNDCDGDTDEDFRDAAGVYVDFDHCGRCNFSCGVAGQGAILYAAETACDPSGGVARCVVAACEEGFYLPEGQTQVCLPTGDVTDCSPCGEDAHCEALPGRCLDLDGGRFCGRSCGVDGDCPAGYGCDQGACVPASGSCTCLSDDEGALRSCARDNAFGRCSGFQACEPSLGWSPCDAREPAADVCNGVDDDCDGLVDEGCAFQLCEFVASGSEKVPSPSWLRESDRRAGSLEFNFNGGHGYNGENTDFPYAAGFFTLRNGAGQLVEQLQVNRRWHPPLDENGCSIGWVYPQCWLWPDGEELIEAFIPTWSTGSNSGFDDPLDRVEVSGGALMDFTVGEPMDNSHETMVFTFTDPAGLDTAQMIFRGRFDWDLDGLDVDDVMIPIFRRNMPGNGPDFIAPFVAIVAESATEITLSVNVAEALDFVRAAYDALGFFDAP